MAPTIDTVLPPLVLGTATFNHQYNHNPENLGADAIIKKAFELGIHAFDTSPYYGPSEIILGQALANSGVKRDTYFLTTKCGRIAAEEFNYTPAWVRKSIDRSLERLKTDYLDLVFAHDVEFVTYEDVLAAVTTLRELREQGKIRYVGISGYPVETLAEYAERILEDTKEPLDSVMSYANYTLQSTKLGDVVERFVKAGVKVVQNASPLGMGLLRQQGVPVGAMGDFHPAPEGLRQACKDAAEAVKEKGERLEKVALRWTIEDWGRNGAVVGVQDGDKKRGVSVAGCSSEKELEELIEVWNEVMEGKTEVLEEFRELGDLVIEKMGKTWKDYEWASPGEGYVYKKPEEI
jgi:D-arabinose 1-dehydrogenase